MIKIASHRANYYQKIYLRRALRVAFWYHFIPSVLLVGVSGSLSNGKATASSDIDLFIISRRGRIFTSRFLCKLIVKFFGIERQNRDKNPAGKICLNYFLSEESLDFKPHSHAVIDWYRNSIILYSKGDILNDLIAANRWLKPEFTIKGNQGIDKGKLRESTRKDCHPELDLGSIQPGNLCIFGNKLEGWLKHYQIKKIESDPITKKYPDKIVYNDLELRFHPPKGLK